MMNMLKNFVINQQTPFDGHPALFGIPYCYCHKSYKEITSLNNTARILTPERFYQRPKTSLWSVPVGHWSPLFNNYPNMGGPRHASCALNLVRTASPVGSWGHRTTSDPASATTCQCDFFCGKSIILHCYPQTPNKLLHVIHTHSSHGLNSRIDNCESSRNHKGLMRQLDFSHHIAEARICKHHIDLGLRPRTGWDQNDSTSH